MKPDYSARTRGIKGVPKECWECVAFHQEGHISLPCRGDFDSRKCEDSIEPEPPE